MSQNLQVGSSIAIVQHGHIRSAVIERETKCYWMLSNGCRLKKGETRYFDSRDRHHSVEAWSDEHELKLQAQKVEREKIAALNNTKYNLHNYLGHMQIGYFVRLNHSQIFALEKACQDILGNIPKR